MQRGNLLLLFINLLACRLSTLRSTRVMESRDHSLNGGRS